MGFNNIDFNKMKGFICDMDGVIYHGNRILPGVREFMEWLKDEEKEYLFLTNNSSYTPRELNHKLQRMDTDIISALESGMSTVRVLSGISTEDTLKHYAYKPDAVLAGVGDIVSCASTSKDSEEPEDSKEK